MNKNTSYSLSLAAAAIDFDPLRFEYPWPVHRRNGFRSLKVRKARRAARKQKKLNNKRK